MAADNELSALKNEMKIEPGATASYLEDFIRTHVEKLDREGIILGLSGGVDSAVTAALCSRAVSPEKVRALLMPEKDSAKEHIEDAVSLAEQLKIEYKLIDIGNYLKKMDIYKLFILNKLPLARKSKENLVKKAWNYYGEKTGETPFLAGIKGLKNKEYDSLLGKSNAYYRVKHRLRMLLLYLHAETENRLVVGAANKTEYKIGYFVKHGCDDAADIMPLLNLYKTQVRQLAGYLDIPPGIINKPPSPDIVPGLTDEEAIGIPYDTLDLILVALEKGWEIPRIVETTGIAAERIVPVKNLISGSEHMRTTFIPDSNSLR